MSVFRSLSVLAAAAAVALVACSSRRGAREAQDGSRGSGDSESALESQLVPTALAEVERAQRLGALIYKKDKLAAVATDVMLEATSKSPDPSVRGWIVDDAPEPAVVFVGETGSELSRVYEVTFAGAKPSFTTLPEGTPLSNELAARYRARRTASKADFRPCSARYNSVVIPASMVNQSGWYVYLLAATTEPGTVVVGGHHRMHVSEDGARVRSATPLSKSCLSPCPAPKCPRVVSWPAQW